MTQSLPPLMAEVVRQAVSRMVEEAGGSGSAEEAAAVAAVCLMSVYRSGREDPRAELKKVSDPMILHLVKSLPKMKEVKPLAKVGQFFLVEWCHRNGYLEEDWRWEWVSRDEGQLHFKPTIPLEMIPIPSG